MTKKNHPDPEKLRSEEKAAQANIKEGRLWAPWRMKYIQAAAWGEDEECFLCVNPTMVDNEKNLLLHRGRYCFVIMNLYPYNNGHIMVAPYRHIGDFMDLTSEEMTETMELTRLSIEALSATMHPHGYNIGLNLGRVAGAGIEEHLHLHIVPRWDGDTNFMPVLAETKVVSESLHESWRRLRQAFEGISKKG